jgi:hypothetical protein
MRVVGVCLFLAMMCASYLHAQSRHDTLKGTVMCGYQGWFAAPGDGADVGWRHYGFHKAGQCQVDLWPDVSGFGADELHDTPLKFADGRVAQVFSSANPATVRRHFEWMREHGIDGVFLQRFGVSLKDAKLRGFCDRVMGNVRAAATASDRAWALMYDLSGLRAGEIERVVMQDWKRLRNELRITRDKTYLHHEGKPVVAVWGVGFNDNRAYSLEESAGLLRFLRNNPEFGGMTVMVGVPFGWRTLDRDAAKDTALHEVLKNADVISPWSVGRYGTVKGAEREIAAVHEADAQWCSERQKDYLPVVFPGFSWANLTKSRGGEAKLNAIPRLRGEFLWSQAAQRIRRGADMLYVAMFDELDEGTAIFKCADETPVGTEGFVTNEGLPGDNYLWLTGQVGRALRKEIPADEMPKR